MGIFGVMNSVASSPIFNTIADISSQLLQNYSNERAQKRQQAFDLKMWNLQNEYNTPANQVARLRAAGLNPNLMYSQGDVGNATGRVTTSPVKYSYDFGKALDKIALRAQVDNMKAQNENMRAQNRNLNATTQSILLENDLKRRDLELYQKYGLLPHGGLPQQAVKYGVDLLHGLPRYSKQAFDWFMYQFVDKNYGPYKDRLVNSQTERR